MAHEEKTAAGGSKQKETFPLWIDDEWYILVDGQGHCESKCAEGALGFIVQLSSRRDPSFGKALKIPRLVAETDRENAYVAELLAQELAAVKDIFNQEGTKRGLLGALDTDNRLRRPIRIDTNESAAEWDGALLLVRFEKGQNPYFCLFKPAENKVYPPNARVPQAEADLQAKIRESSRGAALGGARHGEAWSQMVFLRSAHEHTPSGDHLVAAADKDHVITESGLAIYNAASALATEYDSTAQTWFTCIPSVTYAWAPNTLQEAIGRNERGGKWTIDQHLQLMEQICSGIKVLHNKGMLHADIRPANIVRLSEPENPLDFYLSDYGSFAYTNARPLHAEGKEPMGDTVVGPVVEGERVSPFYAPERGSGRERETADTAIVVMTDSGPACFAIVGWKSEFMKLGLLDEAARPRQQVNFYTDFINTRREQYRREGRVEHVLDTGDRVQLRDYIFELDAEEEILGNIQVFRCSPKFWTIYHGRIAIYEHRDREACFSFPIPRVIELPQWSAATDIYSLGVLCLYSVYSELLHRSPVRKAEAAADGGSESTRQAEGAPVNGGMPEETLHDEVAGPVARFGNQGEPEVPTVRTKSKSSTVKLDEDFEVMLKYMADKSLFRAVWPQLEWLRHQIEKNLVEEERQNWTADRLAKQLAEPQPEPKPKERGTAAAKVSGAEPRSESQPAGTAPAKPPTLESETEKVISQITSTVPGIELLLLQLSDGSGTGKYQLGPFVFFLHFVLSCLNRQDSLEEQHMEWVEEGWMKVPFCKNRHDRPEKGGAATQALERLGQIRSLIKAGALKGLTTEKIAAFDLRPESEIRRELNALTDEKKQLAYTEAELRRDLNALRDDKKQLDQQLAYADAERAQYAELRIQWEAAKQELEELRGASDASVAQTKATKERQQELEQQLDAMQQRLVQYQAAVKALEESFNAAIKAIEQAGSGLIFKRQALLQEITAEFVKAEKLRPVD